MLRISKLYLNILFATGLMVPLSTIGTLCFHASTSIVVVSCIAICLGMFPVYLPKGTLWGAGVVTYIFVLSTNGPLTACVPLFFGTVAEFMKHYRWNVKRIKFFRLTVTFGMFFYALLAAWYSSRQTTHLPYFFHILISVATFEVVNYIILVGIQLSIGQRVTLADGLGMFNFLPLIATSAVLAMYIQFARNWEFALLICFLFACFVLLSQQFHQAVHSRDIAERQYELIAHYTTELILVVNKDLKITYASPSHEQVFECGVDSITGQQLDSIMLQSDFVKEAIRRIQSFVTNERHQLTLNINGKQLPVETEFSPVLNDRGEVYDIILASRDITERLRQQEYLVHSEKLAVIGQLAAGVAHEIRNPLTAVKGFVQVLKRDFESYSQSSYDIVWSELTRIEEITSELLLLAKPQKAQYKIVDLVPVVRHCVTLLEGQAHKRNVYFDLAFQGAIYSKCNENQIRQVFVNILKNAVESMDDGGVVNISGRLVDDQIVIVIRDQGVGIPEELKTNLGDPFYTTKEKGTGLGLMVVYNILKEHQGNIEIHSEVGVGTEVTIMLPSAQQPGDDGVIRMQSATMVL